MGMANSSPLALIDGNVEFAYTEFNGLVFPFPAWLMVSTVAAVVFYESINVSRSVYQFAFVAGLFSASFIGLCVIVTRLGDRRSSANPEMSRAPSINLPSLQTHLQNGYHNDMQNGLHNVGAVRRQRKRGIFKRALDWVNGKIYLYNVTFGLYMLDWWERVLFNVLALLLLWFLCYTISDFLIRSFSETENAFQGWIPSSVKLESVKDEG